MRGRILGRFTAMAAAVLAFGAGIRVAAQPRIADPPSAKAAAPIDLTGYWVSVVNKEWRFRMVIPARGDFSGEIGGIPMNAAARRIAEAWDPSKDESAGEECKGFGAAGLMRVPGRLHITWRDDNTLRVDTDAGMQTRELRFSAAAPAGPATRQGHSVARWGDGLKVETTNLLPGYLRRNGVPYSEATVMTEYWDLFREPDGTDWLVIATTIADPTYLQTPYETSPAFKREPDGSKWDPSPCSARW